ncbi:MAG: oligosaccharide flippase family protein [Lachnospiraceae bacterium]|nr:oligosaccharide flippase family protein [Lachnospiraceae bacterium]
MKNKSGLFRMFFESKEVKASTAYVICSVLQKCITIITLPLFTRLLTTEEYGISTVYTSTMAVLIIFTTLNLPYGSFSTAMVKFENDRDGYMSSVITICAMFTMVYYVIYLLFRDFWNGLLDLPTVLMILMGFEMLLNTVIHFWMGKARFEYKYKALVAVSLVITIAGTCCSLLAVIFLPNKGVVKIIGSGIVICLVGSIILILTITKGRKCFNKTYWKYALSFNIPLIPYYLSQVIFNQSDRLMINSMNGRSEAALYGVAYTIAFVLSFVLNAVNNSYVPWVYNEIKERRFQENRKVSVCIALFMAVLLLGIIALAPEIVLIMAGTKYMSAVWVVPPVAMSLLLLFYSQLFINVEFFFEEKHKLVAASILAAGTNIVLNYYGIKMFGFVAAGYTTLISYILFAGCNYLAMKRVCRDKGISEDVYSIRILSIILILFLMTGAGVALLYAYRIIRFGIVLVGAIVAFCFRNEIKGLLINVNETEKNE